ncbi:MAG: hypothetical protein N2C14_02090 [Planctomycetales bacterium]
MALHDDLLAIARQMIDRNPGAPIEAELRRAVSTAYYALFHLFIHDGTGCLVATASLRPRVSRTFEHKHMRAVCREYAALQSYAEQYVTSDGLLVPGQLVTIADTFVTLNEARLQADYNTSTAVTLAQATANVERAEQAFKDWVAIQADPATETFLAELWCRGIPKR